jgi:hypothetical protein
MEELNGVIMTDTHTRGEHHGCVVCGKLYQLYVVYSPSGKFIDCKVMSPGGKRVPSNVRPLVACEHHSQPQIEAALVRFPPGGKRKDEDDDE